MSQLDTQDLEDILNGACILACGGGGPYSLGQKLVAAIAALPVVDFVDPSDVDGAAQMAVSAGVGSPDAAMLPGKPNIGDVAVTAYDALAEHLGVTFPYVLPGEVGAANSLVPVYVAAKKGLPVVDVSGAPRAMPLFDMTSFEGHVPVTPVMMTDGTTEVCFDAERNGAPSSQVADQTARAIVSGGSFGDIAGVAMFPMTGSQMQNFGMQHTLSRARDLGATLRRAKDGGHDPVEAVADFLGGRVLFMADTFVQREQSGGGFDIGFVDLKNTDGTVTLIAQNENIFGWTFAHAEPIGLGPDFLCYLTEDGHPFSNADPDIPARAEKEHKRIALIGVPASNFGYRTPSVIEAWMGCIGALGYAGPFVPIEQLPSWPAVPGGRAASALGGTTST
ncbi:MAG: DUF917 domain-containing protein [Acidimicrobiales bacterium]|jgi:DUF917 family protein